MKLNSNTICKPIGMGVPSENSEDDLKEALNITGIEEARKGVVKTADSFEWAGEAFLKGQFQTREMWDYDEVSVKLYDLSKTKDLNAYSKLIQDSFKEDPLVVIIDEQKQFCQNAENWKVLVQRATIKYKKLVDKENEKES